MPTYTQHHKLIKPENFDFYDIGVHNQNMDKIDTQLTQLEKTVSNKVSMPQGITAPASLDDYRTAGMYYCSVNGQQVQNTPVNTGAFSLFVESNMASGGGTKQTLTAHGSAGPSNTFIRMYSSGSWYPWQRLATEADLTTLPTETKGVWTPRIQGQETAGVYTYTRQTGIYHRIGSLATVWVDVVFKTKEQGNGQLTITGLPFTNHTGAYTFGSGINADIISRAEGGYLGCYVRPGQSIINYSQDWLSRSWAPISVKDIDIDREIHIASTFNMLVE